MPSLKPNDHCDSIWDLLSAYADGETSEADSARVEAHLDACPSCCRDLRFLRETACFFASEEIAEPPPGLRERILAATVEAQPVRRVPRLVPALRLAPVGLAGALAALAYVAMVAPPPGEVASRTGQIVRAEESDLAPAGTQPEAAKTPAGSLPRPNNLRAVVRRPGGLRPLVVAAAEKRIESAAPPASQASFSRPQFVSGARSRQRGWAALSGPSFAERSGIEPEPADFRVDIETAVPAVDSTAPRTETGALPVAVAAPIPPPAPHPAEKAKVILLAAALPNPAAVTTLADLRRELRHESDTLASYSDGGYVRGRRQVAIDVLRSRF